MEKYMNTVEKYFMISLIVYIFLLVCISSTRLLDKNVSNFSLGKRGGGVAKTRRNIKRSS